MPLTRVSSWKDSKQGNATVIEIDRVKFEISHADLADFDTMEKIKAEIERQALLSAKQLPDLFFHKNRDGSIAVATGSEPNKWPEDEDNGKMRKLIAWLRMMKLSGDYPVPMSDISYNNNIEHIDYALPTNGGRLQTDGSWLQEGWKFNHDFGQGLKEQAHANNQIYMPIVDNNREFLPLLLSPSLQVIAADNLVELATVGRFDSPWDGVMIDLEGIPSAYKKQLSDFLYLLDQRLHTAGLSVGVSVRGKVAESGDDYDNAYSYDFNVVGQVADLVDLRCYDYWEPTNGNVENRSTGPFWWVKDCIEYALSKGIPNERIYLGLTVYSNYHPEGTTNKRNITYDNAIEIAGNEPLNWIESNEIGIIREIKVDLPIGHIWMNDVNTLRHRLELVDDYDLVGSSIFVLGMEDERIWNLIGKWKNG